MNLYRADLVSLVTFPLLFFFSPQVWTSAMTHPSLEKALDMGGFGYPALAVANLKKKVRLFELYRYVY